MMFRVHVRNLLLFITIVFSGGAALGQTSSFTYQGRLTDGGVSANGNYDLQVALFDSGTGGSQIGQTQTITNVLASGGVFTVTLDFGPAAFSGTNRFLEISTRPSGAGNYTLLTPRQPITSTPYAVRSSSAATADTATNATNAASATNASNATNADNAKDAQKLGGVAAGNYVQTGDARLSDARPPIAGNANYIQNTTTQQADSSFNVSGTGTVGGGVSAANYLIKSKLILSTNGDLSTPGHWVNIAPFNDVVFGTFANISLGSFANVDLNPTIPFAKLVVMEGRSPSFRFVSWDQYPNSHKWEWQATYINNVAAMNLSNISNLTNPFTVLANGNVGIGNTAPAARLRVEDVAGGSVPVASFGGRGDFYIDFTGQPGGRFTVKDNGFVGIGTGNPVTKLDVDGAIRFAALGSGGTTQLCRNSTFIISGCSSSLRYKTDLHPFMGGLNLINRLHPITFKWKADQTLDFGLGAEDVAAVEPLLVTHNDKGEIEGVKYDRLGVVFINAFKEQQAQIERQGAQIERQQAEIEMLKKLVCSSRRHARGCK